MWLADTTIRKGSPLSVDARMRLEWHTCGPTTELMDIVGACRQLVHIQAVDNRLVWLYDDVGIGGVQYLVNAVGARLLHSLPYG